MRDQNALTALVGDGKTASTLAAGLDTHAYANGGTVEGPTEAQKKAGNYKKRHETLHGMDLSIENEKGSTRSGKDPGGKPWSVKMPAHYGYIKGTKGADGDHVDAYIGPHKGNPVVHVVDQVNHETGKFDEHKAMLGFRSKQHALDTYHAGFSDGKGKQRVGGVTSMHVGKFRDWLSKGKRNRPIGMVKSFAEGGYVSDEDYNDNQDENPTESATDEEGLPGQPPAVSEGEPRSPEPPTRITRAEAIKMGLIQHAGPETGEQEAPTKITHAEAIKMGLIKGEGTEDSGTEASPPASRESSMVGAFTRGAVRGAVPAAGFLPGMGAGFEAGAAGGFALAGPPGAAVGGFGGALIGGMVTSGMARAAQDAILEKLGLRDKAQEQADEEQHPYASMAGDLAPNALAFAPSLAASAAHRAIGAGAMGAFEAGNELYQGNGLDPGKIALAAAAGAVMNRPTKAGEAGMGLGRSAANKVGVKAPGRPDTKPSASTEAAPPPDGSPPTPEAPATPDLEGAAPKTEETIAQDKLEAGTSQPPTQSLGTSESRVAPPDNVDIGNRVNPPERSERTYQKDAPPDESRPTMTDGTVPPDIAEALGARASEEVPESKPEAQSEPQPAQAETPDTNLLDHARQGGDAPIDTGLEELSRRLEKPEVRTDSENPAEGMGEGSDRTPAGPEAMDELTLRLEGKLPHGNNEPATRMEGGRRVLPDLTAEPPKRTSEADVQSKIETGQLAARADAKVGNRPTVEGSGMTAKTETEARNKSRAMNAAQRVFEHFAGDATPADGRTPVSLDERRELHERLKEAVHFAEMENLGEHPLTTYKPRKLSAAQMWLRSATRIARAKTPPSVKAAAEFVAQDKLLKSGVKGDADLVRSGNRIEGDIANRRQSPTDLANADHPNAPRERGEAPEPENQAFQREGANGEAGDEQFQARAKEIADEPHEETGLAEAHADDILARDEHARLADNLQRTLGKPVETAESELGSGKPDKGARAEIQERQEAPWEKTQREIEQKVKSQRAAREAAGKKLARPRERTALEDMGDEKPLRPKDLAEFFNDTSGALNYSAIKPAILTKFKPLGDWWVRNLNPELFSEKAFSAEPFYRGYRASQAALHRGYVRLLDAAWYHSNRWPEAERLDFMDRMERRLAQPDPVKQRLADFYRKQLDEAYRVEKTYGSRAQYIQDYFPHMWKDPAKAKAWVSKMLVHGSYGPRWFQKARIFDLVSEGLKADLELKSTNPAELVTQRLLASSDMRSRMQLLRDLNSMGQAHPSKTAPAVAANPRGGWFGINAPNGDGWLISPDQHPLWTNAVDAKGLWAREDALGSAYRGWMALKNVWVPVKLALSAFHPLHVVGVNLAENLRRGFLVGDVKGALKDSMMDPLFARDKKFVWFGKDVHQDFEGKIGREAQATLPEDRSPHQQYIADVMQEGGFSTEMSEQIKVKAGRDLAEAWGKMARGDFTPMNLGKIGINAFRRTMETMQAPIFERWIPNLKTAAYMRDVAALLQKHPEYINDHEARRVAFSAIAKSIDNRFGEMFYNNVFINRTAKDTAIGSFLSFGWNYGFLREFGGAATEGLRTAAARTSVGPRDRLHEVAHDAAGKASYVTAYLATSFLAAGAMTYALTGQAPSDALDYIYPRAGGTNPDGSARRLSTMFYTREGPQLTHHIQEQGGGATGLVPGMAQMLYNKMAIAPLVNLVQNKDFFGNEIYSVHAPWYQRVAQAMKTTFGDAFNPVAITGAQRARETGGGDRDVALAYAGFSPAPAYIARNPMQNKIEHLFQLHVAPYARPYEGRDDTETRRQARGELDRAKANHDQPGITAAMKKLESTGLTAQTIMKQKPGESDLFQFSRLPKQDQQEIIKEMNDKEFKRYVLGSSPVRGKRRVELINFHKSIQPVTAKVTNKENTDAR